MHETSKTLVASFSTCDVIASDIQRSLLWSEAFPRQHAVL